MAINTGDTRRDAAFFHWLGKVFTKDANIPGAEKYKSAHNVRSNEVWMDNIPFAQDSASASQFSSLYSNIVRKVGTASLPGYLYPLHDTDYQSWFLDTGTPSLIPGGAFYPSNEWIKPLINPSELQTLAAFHLSDMSLRYIDQTLMALFQK